MGLLLSAAGWGQTVDLEEQFLNGAFKSGAIDQTTYSERGKKFNKMKAEYPVFPYDTTSKRFVVSKVLDAPGLQKRQIMKRLKEWAAINFGALSAVLHYEDEETGKIILKGFSAVEYTTTFENIWGKKIENDETRNLHFTIVFTVKDGRVRVQYENVEMRYKVGGYTAGTTYVPVQEKTTPLEGLFPVTAANADYWPSVFKFVNASLSRLSGLVRSMDLFLKSTKEDGQF